MSLSQQSQPSTDRPQRLDFDLEDWLLSLVLHNNPEWKLADGSCPECLAEVERMKERADAMEVPDLPERQRGTEPGTNR